LGAPSGHLGAIAATLRPSILPQVSKYYVAKYGDESEHPQRAFVACQGHFPKPLVLLLVGADIDLAVAISARITCIVQNADDIHTEIAAGIDRG